MRSFGDLPRPVLMLEGLGIVMLVLAYLSIHGHLQLPGWLASQQAAVGMIFLGVALMVPAAAFLVWRVVQGLRAADARRPAAGKTIAASRNRKIIRTAIRAP